jgi:hypothetical protein
MRGQLAVAQKGERGIPASASAVHVADGSAGLARRWREPVRRAAPNGLGCAKWTWEAAATGKKEQRGGESSARQGFRE